MNPRVTEMRGTSRYSYGVKTRLFNRLCNFSSEIEGNLATVDLRY